MIKDMAFGAVMLAQSIAMPYDGVWQLGDKCDVTNTNEMLTINEGRAIGNGFVCYYDSVRPKSDDSYIIISRCYEGTSPAKFISYTMRVSPNTIWIFNNENGILHSKLSRCNG